jgi:hypothetical protein
MRILRSERGQMTVEMVLLAIIALSVALVVSSYFREKQVLKTLVGGPWSYLRTMNEYGVWLPSEKNAVENHPNGTKRVGTPKPI